MLILEPRLTVSSSTSLDVSKCSVNDHGGEEERIEPRERRAEACNSGPAEGKEEVACIVDLAGVAICETVR